MSNTTTTKCQRSLRVILIDKERIELGKQLAEESQKLEQIAEDKRSIVADFNARKSASEAKITALSRDIGAGYKVALVDCEWRNNNPDVGKKSVFRLDTGELIETLPMTDAEKQKELPLADPDGGETVKTVVDSDPESGVVTVPADRE